MGKEGKEGKESNGEGKNRVHQQLWSKIKKLEWNIEQQNEVIVLQKIRLNRLENAIREQKVLGRGMHGPAWPAEVQGYQQWLKGTGTGNANPIGVEEEKRAGYEWTDRGLMKVTEEEKQTFAKMEGSISQRMKEWQEEVSKLTPVMSSSLRHETPQKMTPAKMNTSENDTSENGVAGNDMAENGSRDVGKGEEGEMERWIAGDALFEGGIGRKNGVMVRGLSQAEKDFLASYHTAREHRDFWEGLMK